MLARTVRGAWCVVRGAWCVVRGAWCVVRWALGVGLGAWGVERGACGESIVCGGHLVCPSLAVVYVVLLGSADGHAAHLSRGMYMVHSP